jgi:dienelactone hydrolase
VRQVALPRNSSPGRSARCNIHAGCKPRTFAWRLASGLLIIAAGIALGQDGALRERRVIIESQGWHLVADLVVPTSVRPTPGVILLNKAAGDRAVYAKLAGRLARLGIASLRIDLRGHGASINRGRFMPDDSVRSVSIDSSELDVIAAHRYLEHARGVDSLRLGFVGASYSAEAMAAAGRLYRPGMAYVALSPGSLSARTINDIDALGRPWLILRSRSERYVQSVIDSVLVRSRTTELLFPTGHAHATDILPARPDVEIFVAVWLADKLHGQIPTS